MKIAICFSGQIRTGIQTAPNIKRFIGDLWDDCDFFIHTWDFESYKPVVHSEINGISLPPIRTDHIISSEKVENFTACYKPKKMFVEKFKDYKTINGTAINPIWYSTSECFKLMSKYSTEFDTKYDAVIKIRPDVIFGKNRKLRQEISHYLANPSLLYSDCFIKGLVRLDDVFWVLNFENADKITGLFSYITTKMKQLQDERFIILTFLKHNHIVNASTHRELYQYAIYRAESYMFDPMTQYTECFRNDWLHYSGITIEEYFKKIEENILKGTQYD